MHRVVDPAEDEDRQRADGTWLAAALAALALSVQREPAQPMDALAVITEAAARIIPGADCAAVVVRARHGRLDARAVQGDLPPAVMGLQNEVGQGPCLDAVAQTGQIRIANIETEDRWPLFSSRAAALGVQSMMCTPLTAGEMVYGSLSLVSTTDAFDETSADLAAAFGAHGAIALAGAESRWQLTAALSTRDVIGQAKGILMERYGVTPDVAFALLARVSQDTNIKLRDVADELCRTGGLPRPISPGDLLPPQRAA